MGRFGNPSEIITSALFLASSHSSYVTGANLYVDGGWTCTMIDAMHTGIIYAAGLNTRLSGYIEERFKGLYKLPNGETLLIRQAKASNFTWCRSHSLGNWVRT